MSWVRALAWAVTGVSVAFAARYGIALGATAAEALALGATFAILDLFKCHLPRLTMLAMARGWSFVAIAGRVGFGGLSLLNVWGIMSVELLERATLAANQTTVAQQLTEFEAQKGRVENRLRKLGETREVATIEADMTAERRDRRWSVQGMHGRDEGKPVLCRLRPPVRRIGRCPEGSGTARPPRRAR